MSKSFSMKIKILFVFVTAMFMFYGLDVIFGAKEGDSGGKASANETSVDVIDGAVPVAKAESSTKVDQLVADSETRPAVVLVDRDLIDRANSAVVTSYADGLDTIRPAVVSVYSTKTVGQTGGGFPFDDPLFRRFFGPGFDQQQKRIQRGLGSGVIVSVDGYILTNNHVVEDADDVRVALHDGQELQAQIIGRDPRTDVAILKVDASDLAHATLADSDALRVGDVVFAVGNPLGVGQTVTMGIVSATGRSNLQLLDEGYENFIQTDASINPGNSGGALVDAMGRVVGINTAIISTSRGSIGIGFAIPINLASNIMESLIETGSVSRGFLGVSIQNLDPDLASEFGLSDSKGALVVEVNPGSPADEAGLKRGDVLTSVNGKSVDSTNVLRLLISQTMPGTDVVVGFVRSGDELEARVTLGKLDEESNFVGTVQQKDVIAGVLLKPLNEETRSQFQIDAELSGLVVAGLDPTSRYDQVLPVGTVVEQINRRSIESLSDARNALVGGRNLLYVNYRGVYRYVTVTILEE
jgi:serine protease Do